MLTVFMCDLGSHAGISDGGYVLFVSTLLPAPLKITAIFVLITLSLEEIGIMFYFLLCITH